MGWSQTRFIASFPGGGAWTPPGLLLASIPTLTAGRSESDASLYVPRRTEPERAAFTLSHTFRTLRRELKAVSHVPGSSHWSKYLETQTHYTREQLAEKESFVKGVLDESGARRVLDIGANTGHFSELAARGGASVVAIDSDSAAAGRIWQRAVENSLDILPLVVDFCRPTPALGWRNRESGSFLDRARGHFDLVMMLAVVHHMLITERVPLEEILDAIAAITTDLLLIEFIEPADPMFRRLVRGPRCALLSSHGSLLRSDLRQPVRYREQTTDCTVQPDPLSVAEKELIRVRLRDVAGALSLANLCMLAEWNTLLNNTPAQSFLRENPPSRTQLGAAACDTALISLVIYVLILWAHRLDQRFQAASFLVWPLPFVLLMSLRPFVVAVRLTASALESWSPFVIASVLAVLFAAAVFIAGKNILSLGLTTLVTLSPMLAIEGVRAMAQSRAADYANRPLLHRNPNVSLPRVVWIIFDELDYRLSFPERPTTVNMPEFDRLRAQSLFASDAFSPRNMTQTSVLSLLTGKTVTSLELKGPTTANVNGTPLDLQRTIFSTVHGMGRKCSRGGLVSSLLPDFFAGSRGVFMARERFDPWRCRG